MTVRWSARAAGQLSRAVQYLEAERAGAGEALHHDVERAIQTIRDHPLSFSAVPGRATASVRRAFLRRWGYWLIYEVASSGDGVIVISLWYARRAPGGWSDR